MIRVISFRPPFYLVMALLKTHIQLVNNTNYFNPSTSKVVNTFMSSSCHTAKISKQEGIETRLYYEFENTRKLGGQTFFYTLTYNDEHLPHFEGLPCFDYNDLMGFLNGAFKKRLLRDYGITFKYFVGAEFGDGKGKRGLYKNPHYHVLLFLRPSPDVSNYRPISVKDMRHYVKYYWQGFDEEQTGFRDYRTCRFGVAMPSDKGDLVDNFKAINYVAKYVTKESYFYKCERIIKNRLKDRYYNILYPSKLVQNNFFEDYIVPRFAIPHEDLLTNVDWYWSNADLISYISPRLYNLAGADVVNHNYLDFFEYILNEANLLPQYEEYVNNLVSSSVNEQINIWRNRYSNKYRISNGVGICALDDIDETNMTVKMPDKSGFKMRPIPLYYFRKLCCDVVKDAVGNNKYILNEKGIKYQLDSLDKRSSRLENTTFSYCTSFSKELYEHFISLFPSSLSYTKLFDLALNRSLIKRYSYYKYVYEYRYYDKYDINPILDYHSDYLFFISSRMNVDYCPNGTIDFLKGDSSGYLPFSCHPYFQNYIYIFHLYDFLNDYHFTTLDMHKKRQYDEVQRLRSFHKSESVTNYFKQFK